MIKAVLLDLDDTLLRLEVDGFIEQYNRRISQLILAQQPELSAIPAFDDSRLRKAVRDAVQAVLAKQDPTTTNQETFRQNLSRRLDIPSTAVGRAEDVFFRSEYKHLQPMVTPIAGAAELLDYLFTQDVAVVIATNPVFPLKAVKMRMGWAGLNPELPYALITALEGMHFAKPNAHYYEEILARVGVEPDEALMVGDNPTFDIAAAQRAGLHTFWIDDAPTTSSDPGADARGSLADLVARLRNGWLAELNHTRPATIEQVIPRLIGNTGALEGLVRTADNRYWTMHPDPDEWSPLEILCHLRNSEREVHRPRLQRIATEDNPFITAPSGPKQRDVSGENPVVAFRQFWAERSQTINFLNSLKREAWQRPARDSVFGPTTLLEMALFTARHDHLHINQLCQTIGRCSEK